MKTRLLKRAFLAALLLQAADIAGALAVHAKNEEARRFYGHFDFTPSPADPMHLFVLLKDVRRVLLK